MNLLMVIIPDIQIGLSANSSNYSRNKRRIGGNKMYYLERETFEENYSKWIKFLMWKLHSDFLEDFLGSSTEWMLGRTPPWAMVTPARSTLSSSSFLMASWR